MTIIHGQTIEDLSREDLIALHDQLIEELEQVEEELELRR
jgi:hypothetical protein